MNELARLHPDLQRYYLPDPSGRYRISHPLLTSDYQGVTSVELNEQYERNRIMFKTAVAWGDWEPALFMVQAPHCMRFLWENRHEFDPADYWRIMVDLWHGVGAFDGVRELIRPMLNYRTDYRDEYFMRPFERELLGGFPPLLRVYRGYTGTQRVGWSWTRISHTARWYSQRFKDPGNPAIFDRGIVTTLVRKEQILALLMEDSYNEELIIDPDSADTVTSFSLDTPCTGSSYFDVARTALAVANSVLPQPSYHDSQHWVKVDYNAVRLCECIPAADLHVCRLFAYLHDLGCDGSDLTEYGHGRRAARFIEEHCAELISGLTPRQRGRLLEAVRHQNARGCVRPELARDPTIAVCWDADYLDTTRFMSLIEDEDLLTPAARELKWLV